MGMAQGNHLLEKGQQFRIPLLRLIPGVSRAGVRVCCAGHADLCAIVDTGRTGHSHLEQSAEAQRTLVTIDDPKRACRIVAVHKIQLSLDNLPIIKRQRFLYGISKLIGTQGEEWKATGPVGSVKSVSAKKA